MRIRARHAAWALVIVAGCANGGSDSLQGGFTGGDSSVDGSGSSSGGSGSSSGVADGAIEAGDDATAGVILLTARIDLFRCARRFC